MAANGGTMPPRAQARPEQPDRGTGGDIISKHKRTTQQQSKTANYGGFL
jgi:hypothetical protein